MAEFVIPAGKIVKVGGLPYELLADVKVEGWRDPAESVRVGENTSSTVESDNDPIQLVTASNDSKSQNG